MLTPHGLPFLECDAAYPCSGLIQHPFLTNKHNYFQKMSGCRNSVCITGCTAVMCCHGGIFYDIVKQ